MDLSDSCVSCTFPQCVHTRKRKPRTVHSLRAEQSHSRYTFSAHNPISATIDSGDVVEVSCWDSSEHDCGRGEGADAAKLQHLLDRTREKPLGAWGNPLCDPIVVKGAMPGDILKVEIMSLKAGSWGWTCVHKDFGLLMGTEESPKLFETPKLGVWRVHHERGVCTLDGLEGVEVPYRPMLGCIGVAPPRDALLEQGTSAMPVHFGRGDMPAGHYSSGPPTTYGGNVDTKHITVGSTVLLPIAVEGAFLQVGDGHAAQGDGEVCGTAIETDMHVQMRVSVVRKGEAPSLRRMQYISPGPQLTETPGPAYCTTGCAPDLHVASQQAVLEMISWLGEAKGLSPHDAYMLCSNAGDLKISEVVDAPNWVVSFHMPLKVFVGAE
jgi:acetamidase/formamidase